MNAAVLATATTSFYSRIPISYSSTFPTNIKTNSPNCKIWHRGAVKPNQKGSHLICQAAKRKSSKSNDAVSLSEEGDSKLRKVIQTALWVAEGVYIVWLFLLPYAPGDPVWAISSDTVDSLIGLSLNFFFILPFLNSGWTFLFAPLLFTDKKRDRFKGSLDLLWGGQMFLTNTFLIPYMAIRLNEADSNQSSSNRSQLGTVMTNGASIVGLTGGVACLVSVLWALYGRPDGGFGSIMDRWQYLVDYLGSERLAYAFIWDICLYIIFQPWLIGENLQNVQKSKVDLVNYLRFVPVVGLIAYCLCLNLDEEL